MVHARLMAYIALHPATGLGASLFARILGWFTEHRVPVAAFAVLFLAIIGGGTVSGFAQGALPGDTLYPVKVGVNEPLLAAFTVGKASEARYAAARAMRRLEEAETLAVQGRLSSEAITTVTDNFKQNASAYNALIKQAGNDASPAIDAQVDFQARIQAHGKILATLAAGATSTESGAIHPLTGAIDEEAREVEADRNIAVGTLVGAEAAPASAKSEKGTKKDGLFAARVITVQTLIDQAAEQAGMTTLAAGATLTPSPATTTPRSFDDRVRETVTPLLTAAEDALVQARDLYAAGDVSGAYKTLLDAERSAKTADIYLDHARTYAAQGPNDSLRSD